MELQSAIEKSEQWMIKASLMCDGIEIDSSARSRIPATLFHLCVEPQQGKYTLTKEELLGSAFALLRPIRSIRSRSLVSPLRIRV
jgi:hypothetical protein